MPIEVCVDPPLCKPTRCRATMTIADIEQSTLVNGNVNLVSALPSGPSQYERLGTIHDIDLLENIEREMLAIKRSDETNRSFVKSRRWLQGLYARERLYGKRRKPCDRFIYPPLR